MARIGTYSNDTTVTANDRVIGTDVNGGATNNYRMGDISNFVRTTIFPNLDDGRVFIQNEGSLLESFISNPVTAEAYSNEYVASDTAADLTKAIYFSNASTITVGSGVTDVFDSTILMTGVRLIFINRDTATRILLTVASVDTTARTITLTQNVTNFADFDGSTIANGSNQLMFVRNNGISLDGSITAGTINAPVTRVNNINPNGPATIRFWFGTQMEFDTQFPGGAGLEADVEYTIYTPRNP